MKVKVVKKLSKFGVNYYFQKKEEEIKEKKNIS